jgi:murein DD-endopeptidase MepM/ murein hydrolase activator NlpD
MGTIVDPLASAGDALEAGNQQESAALPGEQPTDADVSRAAADVDRAADSVGAESPHHASDLDVSADDTATSGHAPSENRGPTPVRGPALRERLLARAAAARAEGGPLAAGLDDLDAESRPPTSPLDIELELIGSPLPERPVSPLVRNSRAPLSPNLIAVFGTLIGTATVASIIALVIHLDPKPHVVPPAPIAVTPAPVQSAVPAPPPLVKRERKRLPGPWRVRDAKGDASLRVIEGEIGVEPFLRAVQNRGMSAKEAYRALAALKPLRNLDQCDKKDRFAAALDRGTGKLKAFEYIVSPEEVYQAREGSDGLLAAKKLDLGVERTQVNGAFAHDGKDFAGSAALGGFEPPLSKVLATALEGHMSLEELKRGDVLRIVAQEVTVLGEFSRYAGVEAVEVRFSDDQKPLRVYYFRGSKSRGYFDDRARSPFEGGWRKPIKDAPVTSHFNPKRLHPVLKKIMPHTGTDFGAPSGTPVGASSFGTVSFVGNAGPSGNLVKIDHANGIETGYAHLSRFADGLRVGDKVKRLQLIGYVGSTGRSTGPHLHFTAKRNGQFFDAETLNMDGMRVLPASERTEFDQVKAKYDALLEAIAVPAALPKLPEPAAEEASPIAAKPVDLDEDPGDDGPPSPRVETSPNAAPQAPGGSVYLTDKDLLKSQAAVDDGEVEE